MLKKGNEHGEAAIVGIFIGLVIIMTGCTRTISDGDDAASPGGAINPSTQSPSSQSATAESPSGPDLQVVDVDTRVTEKNNFWWRYAWQLTVKNNGGQATTFTAQIKWVDAAGLVIETSSEHDLTISAGQEKTFSGNDLISMPGATSVSGVEAEVSTSPF